MNFLLWTGCYVVCRACVPQTSCRRSFPLMSCAKVFYKCKQTSLWILCWRGRWLPFVPLWTSWSTNMLTFLTFLRWNIKSLWTLNIFPVLHSYYVDFTNSNEVTWYKPCEVLMYSFLLYKSGFHHVYLSIYTFLQSWRTLASCQTNYRKKKKSNWQVCKCNLGSLGTHYKVEHTILSKSQISYQSPEMKMNQMSLVKWWKLWINFHKM